MSGSNPFYAMQHSYPWFVQRGRGLPWPGQTSWEDMANTADLMRNILMADMPTTPYPPFFDTYMQAGSNGGPGPTDAYNTKYNVANQFNHVNSRWNATHGAIAAHGCSLATYDWLMNPGNIASGQWDGVFQAQVDAFFAPLSGSPYKFLLIRPSYEEQIGTTPGNWNSDYPTNSSLYDQAWDTAFKASMQHLSAMLKAYVAQHYPDCTMLWGFDVVTLVYNAPYEALSDLEPGPGVCDFVSCDNYGPQPWCEELTDYSQCANTIANPNPTPLRSPPWNINNSDGSVTLNQNIWNTDGIVGYAPNAPLKNMMQSMSFLDARVGSPSGGNGTSLFGFNANVHAANSILGSCYRLSTDQTKPLPFLMSETGFGAGTIGSTVPWGNNPGENATVGADYFALQVGGLYTVANCRNFWPEMKKIWGAISDTGVPLGCAICWTGENGTAMSGSNAAVGGLSDGGMTRDFDNAFGLGVTGGGTTGGGTGAIQVAPVNRPGLSQPVAPHRAARRRL